MRISETGSSHKQQFNFPPRYETETAELVEISFIPRIRLRIARVVTVVLKYKRKTHVSWRLHDPFN